MGGSADGGAVEAVSDGECVDERFGGPLSELFATEPRSCGGVVVSEPRFVDLFVGRVALLPPSWLFIVPRGNKGVCGGEACLPLPSCSAIGLTHVSVYDIYISVDRRASVSLNDL